VGSFHIGADENGLGSRLGPMIVTAVLAETTEQGERFIGRKLPKAMRGDLDDSKRLMSHTDVGIGEAWARGLTGDAARSPAELFERVSLEGTAQLRQPCPKTAGAQCWADDREAFLATPEQLAAVKTHLLTFQARGVRILEVRSSVVCTQQLNENRARGINRFVSDLHAMERLILSLQRRAQAPVHAVCGKVGGIGQYAKFFGPLAGWLHATIVEGQAESAYQFPTLGRIRFVRDADERAPLVMLASLVGKYVRELFMTRIAKHYPNHSQPVWPRPSGYHDPVTAGFVERTALIRKQRRLPDRCFERDRDPLDALLGAAGVGAPGAAGAPGKGVASV
jgi:ribonuclease HII